MMRRKAAVALAAAMTVSALTGASVAADSHVVTAEPGKDVNMLLLPKFLGILPFDLANKGAEEAAAELQNPTPLVFTGPTAANSEEGQIEAVTNAPTQGFDVVMLSNNIGDLIVPSAVAAQEAGVPIVTWDAAIPSAEGESVFVAQVDFNDIGVALADLVHELADGEGEVAILSATPDSPNQNAWNKSFEEALASDPKYADIVLVDTVYGDDQSEPSYDQALALIDKYPNLKVIQAPTSVGLPAAAKAVNDSGLCDEIKVTGLGTPAETLEWTLDRGEGQSGCAPKYALWSFVDLGYLTYYVAYLIATEQLVAEEGATFNAGRMGEYTITKDPTREQGLRVLMGPFEVYDKNNVEAAAEKDSL